VGQGGVSDRRIIDAEFEVISDPRPPVREWNGVGLPPEWPIWGLVPRLVYVVVFGAIMLGVWSGAHWLTHVIGLS
jgi:hypothetical protein